MILFRFWKGTITDNMILLGLLLLGVGFGMPALGFGVTMALLPAAP
jgi:hypothetical protein